MALFDYDPVSMSPNPDAGEEELPFREGQILKVTDLLGRGGGGASSLLSCPGGVLACMGENTTSRAKGCGAESRLCPLWLCNLG